MHDYFDILGVPRDASAEQIRRACARRAVQGHPDFAGAVDGGPASAGRADSDLRFVDFADIAIDFVDMAEIADRMRAAFFRTNAS